MRICRTTIIINHRDNELILITIAINTKLNFCKAIAWHKQTQTIYFLIDNLGIEK